MFGKMVYSIIIVGVGVVLNVMISGVSELEKEEKISVYIWATILILILAKKLYS